MARLSGQGALSGVGTRAVQNPPQRITAPPAGFREMLSVVDARTLSSACREGTRFTARERGLTTGDNWNATNTDAIANAIGELKRRSSLPRPQSGRRRP